MSRIVFVCQETYVNVHWYWTGGYGLPPTRHMSIEGELLGSESSISWLSAMTSPVMFTSELVVSLKAMETLRGGSLDWNSTC